MSMEHLKERLERFSQLSLWVGVATLALAMLLGLFHVSNFFQSYLYAYIFWVGLALGCLILLLIGHLAGGPWAAMIRKPLEAGVMVIPVMAVLFIPILFGMGNLYQWTNADYVAHNEIVANKKAYLNVSFFIIRSIIYFAAWTFLALRFTSWSKEQDHASPQRASDIAVSSQKFSAGGLVLFVITMTFAAFDWSMSLRADWFSGLYGVIFMIGQAISAVAFMILVTYLLANVEPLKSMLKPKYVQDLGNFMMAFTLFWAYVNVSQLIIIWSGNMAETNPWYVDRLQTSYAGTFIFLGIFHFAAPFVILFSRWVKQNHRFLVIVACWMLFARLVDIFFYVVPEFGRSSAMQLHLSDILTLIGIGGIWLYFFVRRLKNEPILPENDPRTAIGLGKGAH